jgi:hypothetical protein
MTARLRTTEGLFPSVDVRMLFKVLLGAEDFEAMRALELA